MYSSIGRLTSRPLAAGLVVASALLLVIAGLGSQAGAAAPANLIVNGSFEDPPPVFSNLNFYPAIPGWTETTGCLIETWANGFIRTADDGVQLLELDANCNSRIEQPVSTTAGGTYLLSYSFSARPETDESSNAVNVFVNGALVDSHSSGNTTGWDRYSVLFTASGPSTIAFAGAGDSDSLGSLLDNVSLLAVATNKDECKKGGWASLVRADGTGFKNQGDCVSYTNTGK